MGIFIYCHHAEKDLGCKCLFNICVCGVWATVNSFGFRAKVQQFNLTFRVPAPRKRWIPYSEPAIYFQELKNGKSFCIVFNISRCQEQKELVPRVFCPIAAVS